MLAGHAEGSLAETAKNRAWVQLRNRLKEGADVDEADATGATALHWACSTGLEPIVKTKE